MLIESKEILFTASLMMLKESFYLFAQNYQKSVQIAEKETPTSDFSLEFGKAIASDLEKSVIHLMSYHESFYELMETALNAVKEQKQHGMAINSNTNV